MPQTPRAILVAIALLLAAAVPASAATKKPTVRLSASTRNWSRNTVLNWPVFISGTSTRSKPLSRGPRFFGSGQMWRTWMWLTFRPCSRQRRTAWRIGP